MGEKLHQKKYWQKENNKQNSNTRKTTVIKNKIKKM
jgi:hypothetical protein